MCWKRSFGFLLAVVTSLCQGILDGTQETICIGTNGRMSVVSNREHHYQNLRDRYTNCTYVDGNLELTWLEDDTLDLSFLNEIREVTGYVLVSHVKVKRIVLPKLMIIRGRTLFKLAIREEEFAIMAAFNHMENLEMPSLRDVLAGNVGFFNNFNLCHIKTINWTEILTGKKAKDIYVYNFTHPERSCQSCHPSCEAGCWGEGPQNCQRFSKINCSPQCHQGRCFGSNPRDCCHPFCVGGCTGPTQGDCFACGNVYDDTICKQECPPIMRYNPDTYFWENNPEGKYAYGTTCVKNCPQHLLKDSGAMGGVCVRNCPPTKKAVNGECVLCDGPCPKNCQGVPVVHASNIEDFRGCTIIEGSLTILDSSFTGFQDVYANFSFGPRHPEMSPDKLEVFSTLKEVTGYINIQAFHKEFRNLSYFRNLETIGGRNLTEYFSALYIVKTSLESLDLHTLRTIRSGQVRIFENSNLCFAENINWTRINPKIDPRNIYQNALNITCVEKQLVCDPQCGTDGCWGKGPKQCLACKGYKLDDTCIADCSMMPGIYDFGNKICKACHEECLGDCSGPGSNNCTNCKHVRDGPFCVKKCPQHKYNLNGECQPCHEACTKGCSGPNNTLGTNGCNSCEKAIVNADNPNIVAECLKADEVCPAGYYHEYIRPVEEGALKNEITGRSVCRKCHSRCKTCTAYGIHVTVCKCQRYISGEQCEDECPRDHYHDDGKCIKCSLECRGCYGPTTNHCLACRNFKVYSSLNQTYFNCTASCPDDMPYRRFDDEKGDLYCSIKSPSAVESHGIDKGNTYAILGGVIGCVLLLGLFSALLML